MDLTLTDLRRRDHRKAIQFALEGMHCEAYFNHALPMKLYGLRFFYSELNQATQAIAAYEGSRLIGLLLARMDGEPQRFRTLRQRFLVQLAAVVHRLFVRGGAQSYDQANEEMFARYTQNHQPQGELLFLVADPQMNRKGVGTLLLQELERRERGKTIYLFTDDNCSWQFYEHRGFERAGEKDIHMLLHGEQVPLKCLLYSKTLGS